MTIFFDKLQDHSEVKIEILNRYYIPWLRKINLGSFNSGKCLVIDGFAGKGVYEDGRIGSPLVLIDGAIDLIDQLNKLNRPAASISIVLIEQNKKNFDALIENIDKRHNIEIKDSNYDGLYFKTLCLIDYPTIKLKIYNTDFQDFLTILLNSIEKNNTLIPSFCFVDPFGFSNTPFELFQRYLQNEKSELLFNFMFEEINRFIKSDKNINLIKTYQDLFGIRDIGELRNAIGDTKAKERKQIVIDFYSRKLLSDTQAKYVLNFEFKKKGKPKMFLIYATKNINGLKVMKDVMWEVDDTGAYLFDDSIDANQIKFDFSGLGLRDEMRLKLASLIHSCFSGRKEVSMQELQEFILTQTSFPLTNYFKQTLRLLEEKEYITVDRMDGSNKKGFNEKKIRSIDFMERTFDV